MKRADVVVVETRLGGSSCILEPSCRGSDDPAPRRFSRSAGNNQA